MAVSNTTTQRKPTLEGADLKNLLEVLEGMPLGDLLHFCHSTFEITATAQRVLKEKWPGEWVKLDQELHGE